MTALAITPNYEKKRLKLAGTVAAGEHVAVTIVGGGAWIGTGKALRLRVICGARTVAKFPFWTEDNAEDWPEDVVSADAWASANEGADATCVLNLNTVPAAKLLRFGGMCLWVLDDAENHTLYGSGEYIVEPWPKERGEDEPYNLDEYPDIVAELGERIDAAEESISGAVDEASGIVAYVTAARNDAQTAAQTAGTARSQAQQAKGAAEDAQTAAETAQGLAETAQGKAEDAQTAAEVAQAAAEAAQEAAEAALPLDTTLATEGKAADAKAVGDALDAKADATATSAALLALDSEKADKATTLAGYGIADALISNGTVILGSNSITPLTSHQDISGKADKSTTYTKTEVDAIVQALKTGSRQIVGTLPASGEPMVIYMVPKSASQTNNAYDEYIWTAAGAWEKIGDTEIDLSGYYTKTATDTLLAAKQDTISDLASIRSGAAAGATAVQPESGKGLSTNDYTTAEKQKLDGIAAGAEVNVIETVKVNGTALSPSGKAVDVTVPTGTAASKDVPTSGDASDAQVVMGNDSRLTDARTPTSHTHAASDITSGLATVATSGAYSDLSGTPTLAAVATSGSYNDLSNTPSIPSSAADIGAVAANAAITGATKCKITYDSKGLVTAGADLAASDIPTLTTAKLSDFDAAIRYAMPAAVALVAENDAATLVCADRAVTNATIATGFSTLNLTFPAAVSGYVRDFYLRITVAAGESAPALSIPQGITIENPDGAVPEIADGETSAASTTLVWFSETASNVFTAKSETVKAVA